MFKNLTAVLEASGSSVEHIVKATVFLADMNDYNAMNELYRKQFKGDPPARTTVQVARLPRDARIEISCRGTEQVRIRPIDLILYPKQ